MSRSSRIQLGCLLGGMLLVLGLPRSVSASVLNFDELASGTVVNEHYAFMGVHLYAVGTGLGPIIATTPAAPCAGTAASPPNVLSYQSEGVCPDVHDELGWFVVDFDTPQNQVSITAIHQGPDAAAYLKAYGADGFIEIAWSVPGAAMTGVPQVLTVAPPLDRQRITRVLFGVYRSSDSALFDDLFLDLVVPNASTSWGTLKALWR
jgi:hypothetical protein